VKVDPFIEAEEAGWHSVKRCCDLLQVSRGSLLRTMPSGPLGKSAKRCRSDSQDYLHPCRVKGRLWLAKSAPRACQARYSLWTSQSAASDGTCGSWETMQEAL